MWLWYHRENHVVGGWFFFENQPQPPNHINGAAGTFLRDFTLISSIFSINLSKKFEKLLRQRSEARTSWKPLRRHFLKVVLMSSFAFLRFRRVLREDGLFSNEFYDFSKFSRNSLRTFLNKRHCGRMCGCVVIPRGWFYHVVCGWFAFAEKRKTTWYGGLVLPVVKSNTVLKVKTF